MPKRGATGEPGGATKFEQAGIDAIAFPRNGDGLVYVFATHTAPNTAVASVVTPNSTPVSARKNKKAKGAVSHATAVCRLWSVLAVLRWVTPAGLRDGSVDVELN